MISQHSIDAIFQAIRIEEVVEEFVNLTKRGVNYKGLCPFHDEKTPSFTVSPTRNIYKCFGCGKGGNGVNFLMEHEGFSYPEALRYLAKKYNIEIEETGVPAEYEAEKLERDSLYLINQYASEFYQKQLFETDLGKSIGLSYFKERGLILKTIQQFELGFAPPSGDALTQSAVDQGYNIDLLRKLGLTTDRDRDFFFNRVIIPIHNLSGKVVAFAGRQLSQRKKSPKYINSKESDVYHKSKVLYGLHLAKQAIRKEDFCILVEGYTDVLAMHQSGIENVVASSGTALTPDQIKLVKRYSPQITMLYDGDTAGVKAAIRGIDLVLEQDMNVQVVMLPDGEDPDSYLSTVGSASFREYLEQEAKDFILFKTNLVLEESAGDPVKKASLIKDIVTSLSCIPDPIKRAVYLRQCAGLLSVDEQILVDETNKAMSKRVRDRRVERIREAHTDHQLEADYLARQRASSQPQSTAGAQATDEFQERDIARILVLFGHKLMGADTDALSVAAYLLSSIQETIPAFDNQLYAQLATEYGERLSQGLKVDTDYFLQHSSAEIASLAVEFCATPYEYSENWQEKWGIRLETQPEPDENIERDTTQALLRFTLRKYQKMSEENLAKIKEYQEASNESEVLKHLQVQSVLMEKRNEIAEKLNTVVL